MMISVILLTACVFCGTIGVSIWEVGDFRGRVPELNASLITPRTFFDVQHKLPFVARKYHKSLDEIASASGFTGDSLDWLAKTIGETARISSLEGELQETRLAPVIHNIKWKYFFEKFRDLDIYAVTEAPQAVREHLRLFPFFSCGGNSYKLQAPYMWVSGGLKESRSVIHADSHHNQHCVLKGTKRFMIIPSSVPVDTEAYGWLYTQREDGTPVEGFEDSYGDYAANIDVSNVDLNRYPAWKTIPWYLAELHAGDCLYMPIEWYHYVESEAEPTVTWHIWFHLMAQWVDDCPAEAQPEPLSLDQCVFKKPKNVTQHQWGPFSDRASLCRPSYFDPPVGTCIRSR